MLNSKCVVMVLNFSKNDSTTRRALKNKLFFKSFGKFYSRPSILWLFQEKVLWLILCLFIANLKVFLVKLMLILFIKLVILWIHEHQLNYQNFQVRRQVFPGDWEFEGRLSVGVKPFQKTSYWVKGRGFYAKRKWFWKKYTIWKYSSYWLWKYLNF